MNRPTAWLAILGMVALTAASLLAPWPVALLLLAAGLAFQPRLVPFAAITIAIDAAVLWVVSRDPLAGALAGARLSAALAANLAIMSRVGAARLLDGLQLPARATTLLAAVLIAAQDVARDFERLVEARKLDGDWPSSRFARARAAARLMPALFVAAERRAAARRDALQMAGYRTRDWFVPLVAVAALAAAGRLALIALPNVSFTFVIIFLGGFLYGPIVGMTAGLLAMGLTDFMITGIYPLAFVNAPAMALVGLAGAALRNFDFVGGRRAERAAGVLFAFSAGVLGTLLFSVSADTLTWLFVAPGNAGAWVALVLLGLAFNVLPAFANGLIFAFALRPVARAFQALRKPTPRGGPTPALRAGIPASGPASPLPDEAPLS